MAGKLISSARASASRASRASANVTPSASAASASLPSQTSGAAKERPSTGVSEASTGRSSVEPSKHWQVPTKALLGHQEEASTYSDTSSVRTATTIREFFREEHGRERDRLSGRHSTGRAVHPLRRIAEEPGEDVRPCVLPCVPPGKVPGGRPIGMAPSKTDLMYAPRPPPLRR